MHDSFHFVSFSFLKFIRNKKEPHITKVIFLHFGTPNVNLAKTDYESHCASIFTGVADKL